jgi:hypothetical protein
MRGEDSTQTLYIEFVRLSRDIRIMIYLFLKQRNSWFLRFGLDSTTSSVDSNCIQYINTHGLGRDQSIVCQSTPDYVTVIQKLMLYTQRKRNG